MTQDTRKDPRAKIVSLNVRYKSATVDEFIENHSHDVSKGGIFIKTSTPFPQGTLLKFEIRLSGDQAVIAGVGRVVWKREANTSGSESPAGMGVKFIKIDENSRTVIDRLVGTKANAGSAFTAELEKKQPDEKTLQGGMAAPNTTLVGAGPVSASLSGAPPRPEGGPKLKSTIMGMGAVKDPTPPPGTVTPAAGGGFFPPTNSEADMPPPEERTMMKQAAELLEEALKGAGGSMDEIGTNPLFAGPAAAPRAGSPPPPEAKKELEVAAPPSTVRDTPIAKESATGPISVPAPKSAPVSARPAPRSASAVARVSEATPPPMKKFPAWAWAPILLVIAGGLVFALKPDLFGGTTAVPTAAPIPSTPVSVAPIESAVPTTVVDAAVAEVSDASALAALAAKGDAAVAKEAGPSIAAVVAPPVIKPPPPVAPPKPPAPKPPVTPPVEGEETGATPKPTPTPTPTPPKKPADDSDNPY